MNGRLFLPTGTRRRPRAYVLHGGPYPAKPDAFFGVRLAPEIRMAADVVVPIKDFSVPDRVDLFSGLERVLLAMMSGRAIYVGCMGGRGRTGLFLAALAKLWGFRRPVEYVRRTYYREAVETREQYDFVSSLEFPLWLKAMTVTAKIRGYLPGPGEINTRAAVRAQARS